MKKLMKHVTAVLLAAVLLLGAAPLSLAAETENSLSSRELEAAIVTCRQNQAVAHEMAECARSLGYAEDHPIIREAGVRWNQERTRERQLRGELEKRAAPAYSQEDLDLLARIIYAEAGCTWIPDWVQQMVGSVVLNRVNSTVYPNTIREVIYQPGQYGPAWSGSINRPADARTIANARYLLENGSVCPANVTGQSGAVTGGGVYRSYYDAVLRTTIYFCYT